MYDPIARLNAALKGRYRVDRELGEGGMATIYVAEDLKHERSVALKVLKPELSAVVGAERFLAEIKTTAHLQHPHILPLFDSGEVDGLIYYVMPYVEGETLWDRMETEKQLPVDEAIRIASAVANALDYAHRKGVIHRDIKPANILMQDGQAVVADFGIALAVSAAGAGRLTETGLSVGTPHYMSPEQATGDQTIGPATDIYALGCVLYEMLVGEPPYTGSTPQAILAKIITSEAEPASAHRKSVPLNVDAAVAKALEQVPADRFTSAQDMADALANPSFRHGQDVAAVAAASGSWNRLSVGLAVTTVALAAGLVFNISRSSADRPLEISDAAFGPQRYLVELHDDASYVAYGDLAVTRDGEWLIYTALTDDEVELYSRPLGALESSPLSIPTEGSVRAPFLSPDGEWVGYFTSRRVADRTITSVNKIPAEGGRPITLAENARGINGTWTDDGYVVYTGGGEGFTSTGLYRVPEDGGDPEQLTLANIDNGEFAHHTPIALPEGRGILFRIERTDTTAQTAVLLPETREYRALPDVGMGYPVQYVGTGHLLAPESGSLVAIRFDLDNLATIGQRFQVVDDIQTLEERTGSYASFAVSEAGLLIYAPGGPIGRPEEPILPSLIWVRRDGQEELLPVTPESYGFPRVSPSGDRVAAVIYEGIERSDIWVLDANTGARLRLTNRGFNRSPIWSPDGQYVIFTSDMETVRPLELGRNAWFGNLWRAAADGSTAPERLVTSDQNQAISGVAPDGTVVYSALFERNTRREIWTLSIPDGEIRPLLAGSAMYGNGAVSPDGRWLAHSSDETGEFEIYVQAYPGGGARAPISVGGGSWVAWASDGQELYYRLGPAMMAVGFDTATGRATGAPTELFTGRYSQPNTGRAYDLAPDGRFVVIGFPRGFQPPEPDAPLTSESLVAIVNFFDQVRARSP